MENKVILLQSDRIGDEAGVIGACVEGQLVCGEISGMSTFVELAAKHPVITIG